LASGRPWKLTAAPPIKQTVVADDYVETKIDLPPVLPPEEAAGLLREELRRRHFEEGEGGSMARERNGVRVEVDPPSGGVRVSVEASDEVELPPDNPSPCSCRMRDKLREGLSSAQQRTLTSERDRLQRAVTSRLEGSLARLGCELEGIAHRVTAEALKAKARRLGEVKQITEDPQAGSLTIVVEA
jgi:hypothetical protein